MRLKLALLLVGLSLASAWPSVARAQIVVGNVSLLLSQQAREELGMDATQTERTMSLIDEHKEKMREAVQDHGDLPAARRQEALLERARAVNEHSKEVLATILKPEQMARYEQLELWTRGVTALIDPKVQDALKLDADQREKLRPIAFDSLKRRAQALSGRSPAANVREIEDAEMDKAMSVMTDEQRSKWKAMRGARPTF